MEVVDNIGNLLAISFRANSSLGNVSPAKKFEKLRGPLAKRVSNLEYVRRFIEKYEKYADSWGKGVIQRRAEDLAAEAYLQVWKIA